VSVFILQGINQPVNGKSRDNKFLTKLCQLFVRRMSRLLDPAPTFFYNDFQRQSCHFASLPRAYSPLLNAGKGRSQMKSGTMTAAEAHKQYQEAVTAFRRWIPDPALRQAFHRDVDPFFQHCALGVWQADNAQAITPKHVEFYNAIYSG